MIKDELDTSGPLNVKKEEKKSGSITKELQYHGNERPTT